MGSDGKVYVSHDKWIRVYNADGSLYTEINETTHPQAFLEKSFLRGIDVDENGDIYVVDSSVEFIAGMICQPGQYFDTHIGECIRMVATYNSSEQEKPSLASKLMDLIIPNTHAQLNNGC